MYVYCQIQPILKLKILASPDSDKAPALPGLKMKRLLKLSCINISPGRLVETQYLGRIHGFPVGILM